MLKSLVLRGLLVSITSLLVACSGSDMSDLDAFMAE